MIKSYKLYDGEDIDRYLLRIARENNIKTTNDWKIATEFINKELGNDYGESAYRKKHADFKRGYDAAIEDGADVQELIDELESVREREYKERVRLQDARREKRNILRKEARAENLVEKMVGEDKYGDPVIKLECDEQFFDKVAVLQLSDWHFGNFVDTFWNKFNKQDFDKRIDILFADVVRFCKHNNINILKVVNNGDLINGNIHVSARVNEEVNTVQQIRYIGKVLGGLVCRWSEKIDFIEYYSCLDNHSRANKNYKEHIENENFNLLIDDMVEVMAQNKENINIHGLEFDDTIGIVPIFDKVALYEHGHLSKNKTIHDIVMMARVFPIAVFRAHFHHNIEEEEHMIDAIYNPSLIGVDNYSRDKRMTSIARQKLTVFENRDGEIVRTDTHFIQF